jgi:hypothetical protein
MDRGSRLSEQIEDRLGEVLGVTSLEGGRPVRDVQSECTMPLEYLST